jgi:hypothetical protein
MDKVTATGLAEFERTDVGVTLHSWLDILVEERKERLIGHRGIVAVPEVWHDQGFVDGVRAVAHIFTHAKMVLGDFGEEEDTVEVEVPEPAYLGASSEQPRR